MQNVDLKAVLTGVRPGGCAEPYLAGFAAELVSTGYTLLSARDHVRSAAHLGRWLTSSNMGVDRLNEVTITSFAHHKCACPGVSRHGQRPSGRMVARTRQFADHLGRLGVLPTPVLPAPRALPLPLIGFRAWMTCHRGAKACTINRYERLIAEAMQAEDRRHEVPPADVFGRPRRERRMPHIYTTDEIGRLLGAAAQLSPKASLRPAT